MATGNEIRERAVVTAKRVQYKALPNNLHRFHVECPECGWTFRVPATEGRLVERHCWNCKTDWTVARSVKVREGYNLWTATLDRA